MKTKKLLAAAVLTIAVGAPIAGFVGDIAMSQPTTSTGIRVPFFHGFFNSQSELASLERANEWLNSPPLTAPALHGKVVLIGSSVSCRNRGGRRCGIIPCSDLA